MALTMYYLLYLSYVSHRALDPLNEEKAQKYVTTAINLLATIVRDEMQKDETFSFNRFFKDTKTKVKIEAAIRAVPI